MAFSKTGKLRKRNCVNFADSEIELNVKPSLKFCDHIKNLKLDLVLGIGDDVAI